MSSHEAFLSAICETPDDDTPRLVYADWLDDSGEPERAEFIRAQVELARPPAPRSRTRRREALRRVEALWSEHGKRWSELPGYGAEALGSYERGFCAHFRTETVDQLVEELPRRMTEAPIQHAEAYRTTRDDVAKLVDWPVLARLRSLTLFASSDQSLP
jgi:uncharacterized protein (TIGR02996 family)